MKIKVMVVDDHPVVCSGIATELEGKKDLKVVCCAGNGREAVDLASMHKPDLVFMDMELPDMNGVEVTRKIKNILPGVRILALTMHKSGAFLRSMLEAGASGYVVKDAPLSDLPKAVRMVMAGKPYFSGSTTEMLAELAMNSVAVSDNSALTPREKEIHKMMKNGYTGKQMATMLGIAVSTIKTHVHTIRQKLKDASSPGDGRSSGRSPSGG